MHLEQRTFDGVVARYRPGTSDERVLKEVITTRIYRRKNIGFDVAKGEKWLDLGANIGAFALYCKLRGARAVCYEPDPDCFTILRQNVPEFDCYNVAITNHHEPQLKFWRGRLENDHYRTTAYPTVGLPEHPSGTLANWHGRFLRQHRFDGIKMDIEGAEGGLLDDHLLPDCEKLCMEYHTSRDPDVEHLRARLDYLKSRFRVVSYPPEYDRLMAAGKSAKTFFDRMIFAIGRK